MNARIVLPLIAVVVAACGPELDPPTHPDGGAHRDAGGLGGDGGAPSERDAGWVGGQPDGGQPDGGQPDGGPALSTVRGAVIGIDGFPEGHVFTVIASGRPPVTSTDGTFSIPNVGTPYDLTIIDGARNTATIFRQLTRADVLAFVGAPLAPAPTHSAKVSGTIMGGAYPQSSGLRTGVVIDRGNDWEPSPAEWHRYTDASGGYGFANLQWGGPSTLGTTMYVLQGEANAAGLPMRYLGFGKRALTLAADGTFTGTNVTLAPVASAAVSGNVRLPTGYTLTERQLRVQFNQVPALVFSDSSATDGFSYVTPNLPEGSLQLIAVANRPTGETWHYKPLPTFSASGLTMELLAAPELLLPTDAATAVDTQVSFSWTAFKGGLHYLTVAPVSADAPTLHIVTTETSLRLPDLSAYGMSLPQGVQYRWAVEGFAPFASMDDAVTSALGDQWNNAYVRDFDWGTSVERTFTTK